MLSRRFSFLDHHGPLAFAHRGGALEGAENSMAAFEHAVGLGYTYLETDAHATSDGVLLAFHDHTLDRVTDRRGRIAELPYSVVRQARIAGTHPIPVMEELLGSFPEARFNIDVKEAGAIVPLAEVVRRTNAYERICLTSFSDERLTRARAALRTNGGREVCSALGPRGVATLRAAAATSGYGRLFARLSRAQIPCAQIPLGFRGLRVTTRALVRTAHALGMQVHVWTINDPLRMEHLLDLGVDGIMTDNLTGLRTVLDRRGLWPQHGADAA